MTMNPPSRLKRWIALTVLLAAPIVFGLSPCHAESETPEYDDIDWPAHGSDPSEIISRLEFRNEYVDQPEGAYKNSSIFRGEYAYEDLWLVRTEIPLVAAKHHDMPSEFGLGDVTFGAKGKIVLPKDFSIILGVDFIVDTASDEVLGTGKNQIVPQIAGVWKPSDKWILALQYWYFRSFSGDDEREDIEEMLIRPQALYHLPRGFWLLLDPRIYINREHNDDTLFYLEGEFGKVVNKNIELWARGGGHVTGYGKEELLGWKAEAGIRYLWH